MSGWQIALIVAAVLLLGLVLLPAFNRWFGVCLRISKFY